MNKIFLFVLRRGMKKRLNDALSGSYFGASLNTDAIRFSERIVREEFGWDGNEKTIPHMAYCECFFRKPDMTFYDWPCTCGMTALARGQYWTAFKQAVRFWFQKLESEAKEYEALQSGSEEQLLHPEHQKLGISGLKHTLFQRHNASHRLFFPLEKDSYIQISFSGQRPSQTVKTRSELPHGEHQ